MATSLYAETFNVKSPDGNTEAVVETARNAIEVKILYRGKVLVEKASFSMPTDKVYFGRNAGAYSLDRRYDHSAEAPNLNFNQLELNIGDSAYRFMFRACDGGIFACRFTTARGESDFTIYDDTIKIVPAKGANASLCADKSPAIAKISLGDSTLLISETPPAAGYPKLTLTLNGDTLLSSFKKIKNPASDEPDYIYEAKAGMRFPWRIFSMSGSGNAEEKLLKARKALLTEPKKIN